MTHLQKRLRSQAGFQMTDVAGVFAVGGLAIAVMLPLIQRAVQAKNKAAIDALANVQGTGDLSGFKALSQYEPYYQNQDYTVARNDKYAKTYANGKTTESGVVSDTTRSGKEIRQGADKLSSDDTWK